MKQIIKDIIGFLSSLSGIDLLLYFAVLVLVILIVSLIYIIKNGEEEELESLEEEDLKSIAEHMKNSHPSILEVTDYEAEQEEKAIISYDELLEKSKIGAIHYEEENNQNNEVTIKKINLDSLMSKPQENKTIGFYNYEREEEFLKALKALNKLLS